MFTKSISIVLPVYNEEDNISVVIKEIFNTLPLITDDFEIIAVNDGSTDKTRQILEGINSSDNHLRVIHHIKNKGYGAALVSGFKKAEKELILMMDADHQFNISEIVKLIPYIGDFDVVAGFRIKRKDSLCRRFLGRAFNFMAKIFFGINMRDINCGFKLYKREVLYNMPLITKGSLIHTEIIALANRNKARIKEVGVNHYPRIYGRQTGGSLKVILRAILEALRLRWRLYIKNAYSHRHTDL